MKLYADIPGERLDAFLARSVPDLTRSAAQKLLEEGCVLCRGKPGKKNDKLSAGDEVCLTIPEPKEVDILPREMPLDIVYEDSDVVVISKSSYDNGAPIVKRVIATEGQWVDIDFERGVVYVGDSRDTMEPLDEPYTLTPTTVKEGTTFPLQVDKGHLFVLGDNRNGSKDSRHPEIGLIDKREVLGKVFFLFFPGTNYGQEKQDFGRIGVVD